MLIALRIWSDKRLARRCSLKCRGDNMTMLRMISELRGRGKAVNMITREVAMLFAHASYLPVHAAHLPGVSNTLADFLSRRSRPNSTELPAPLHGVTETHAPPRDLKWYVARDVPV